MLGAIHLRYSFNSFQRIERPLSSLVSDIMIPPSLATTLLDTNVGEPWLDAVPDFERRMTTAKSRLRVKAARDLGDVIEGLRIVVGKFLILGVIIWLKRRVQGGDQTSFLFPGPIPANPKQCHDEYASHPNVCAFEIRSFVFFSTTTGSSSSHRTQTGIHWCCPPILRNWISTIYKKSRCDQGKKNRLILKSFIQLE